MNRKKTGNNSYLKALNQANILDLIREHQAISKIELSELTGLSPTAIGSITSGLQEQGYIYETGTGRSKGGRKPRMLELKPGSFYSIGVDFDINVMHLVLMDITGETTAEKSYMIGGWNSAKNVIQNMEHKIEEAIAEHITGEQKLLGIGVSIPGLVDPEKAIIKLAPNLGWKNV